MIHSLKLVIKVNGCNLNMSFINNDNMVHFYYDSLKIVLNRFISYFMLCKTNPIGQ